MIKIQIKKLSNSVLLPKYETPGSSGMDIAAHIEKNVIINPGEKALVSTGFSVAIPRGYEIQIRPRSGLAAKKNITVLNTPGTIDSDYRGEIKVILINFGKEKFIVEKGERIAQMVVCPVVQADLEETEELADTERGSDGFGSTGTK
jgi:dUTP pyrophosphatase